MLHDFLLVEKESEDYSEFWDLAHNPNACKVHDNFLHYIADTLKWVPSINPASGCKAQTGLCFYGPTVITDEGALVLKHVMSGWAQVFKAGPSVIPLTGGFVVSPESEAGGYFDKFSIDRDSVIETLTNIVHLCEKVARSNGSLYLLHRGI